jgi:acylphosphatase
MVDIDRIRVRVKGTVQDVGYRGFCREKATELGITGYAKNLYDGSVEVVAEGKKDNVNLFLQKIQDFEIHYIDGIEKGVKSLEVIKKENSLRRKYKKFEGLGY